MIITNGKIITWDTPNQILDKYAIYIKDDKIVEIAPQNDLLARYPQDKKLDAAGQYVMPGNICAHTHFYGAYSRGMAIPGAPAKDFPEILDKLWWPLDKSLQLPDVKSSALVCLVDAIKHGTTTLIDHHASPFAIEGSLDVIAETIERSGVRAALCYEVTDRDGKERAQAGIEENVRFIKRVQQEKPANGRLAAMFGLHASLTLSEDSLTACRKAAPDSIGFHIHTAESSADEFDSLAKCGLRVIDRLKRHDMLNPNSIAVHAVHIDAREIQLLAENQTWVTHQPRSNMNNAVGIAPVESMLRAGIKVGLGNDGFSNTMWEEWKAAYLVHKLWNHDPRRMSGTDVAQMAIYNNAELATKLFDVGPVGVLKPGAQADIIFVNYKPYTPLTDGNLPWHIIFGFYESMVSMTMVAGKVLMLDRKLTTLDEQAVADEALALAPGVWQRYQQRFN